VLHQPETGLLIVGERVRGSDAPVIAGQPHTFRLGDQVADGQHQAAFADDDTASLPLGAQYVGGEAVLGDR